MHMSRERCLCRAAERDNSMQRYTSIRIDVALSRGIAAHLCIHICIHIYVYIERDNEWSREAWAGMTGGSKWQRDRDAHTLYAYKPVERARSC